MGTISANFRGIWMEVQVSGRSKSGQGQGQDKVPDVTRALDDFALEKKAWPLRRINLHNRFNAII